MVISLPSACSHGYTQHRATLSPIFSLESHLWAKVIALWHSWLWVPLLLVLATEVVKHMIAGPSHSPVLSHHLTPKVPAEEAGSLGWGHPPPSEYGAERTVFRLHCLPLGTHLKTESQEDSATCQDCSHTSVPELLNSLKRAPAFCKPLLAAT